MGITVLDGDFRASAKISPAPGGIEFWQQDANEWSPSRHFAEIEKLEFVSENLSGSGYSPLMGIVGAEIIGPAGLLLGVNKKKATQTVYFKCTLKDGRYFVGSSTAKEYQHLRDLMRSEPNTGFEKKMDKIGYYLFLAAIVIFLLYLASPK